MILGKRTELNLKYINILIKILLQYINEPAINGVALFDDA